MKKFFPTIYTLGFLGSFLMRLSSAYAGASWEEEGEKAMYTTQLKDKESEEEASKYGIDIWRTAEVRQLGEELDALTLKEDKERKSAAVGRETKKDPEKGSSWVYKVKEFLNKFSVGIKGI